MSRFDTLAEELRNSPRKWLVTGVAGFIGSNLAEYLLQLDQYVVGLDNFATGKKENMEDVRGRVGSRQAARFRFLEGDIRDPRACAAASAGVQLVLHQAAIGSVSRSIADPITTDRANVEGFLQVLLAARDAKVDRVVYASSSSVYGDEATLPKAEDRIGRPLSPYAVSKLADEVYAGVFERTYGLETVGLRYFNVFGRRQDPNGEYAAVIPRWIGSLLRNEQCLIHGDGETSRDFCYIDNVVQANILAALQPRDAEIGPVYNVAVGGRTTLNELFELLRGELARELPEIATAVPSYTPFRPGDVRHSQADISKARRLLLYSPTRSIRQGIQATLPWYVEAFSKTSYLVA
jgi:UDP-N-acetylglucosamine/UDP-N-acetylgalactosamine 4-epimerase